MENSNYLSYWLENNNKTIIFYPYFNNIYIEFLNNLSKIKESIIFSAVYEINDIGIYYDNKIFRANWTTYNIDNKLDSPNCIPLAYY